MKKFLILPIVAALAACSSNEDTVAKPVTPTVHPQVQPVPSTPKPEVAKPEQSKPEVAKPEEDTAATKPTAEKKPKLVPPYYAPHYGHEPVVVAPAPVAASNPEVQEAIKEVFAPTIVNGKLELPTENLVTPDNIPDNIDPQAIPPNAGKDIKSKIYHKGNTALYLFDGFKHQKFGAVSKGDLTGYLSVGTRYIPKDNEKYSKGKATYLGVAMGKYNDINISSQVQANLTWNETDKELEVVLSNGKMHKTGEASTKVENPKLNFTETMTWDDDSKNFVGTEGSLGYIYGENSATEVGGTLSKNIDGKKYEGAFGASSELPKGEEKN